MKLPIAERELRVAARSPKTYRGRLVVCFIFGAITAQMLWITSIVSAATVAAQTYIFVTNIALMMCIFSANTTADLISSEKRGGTLGLLFLTDLKPVDIVAGKLAAAGLLSVYSLLAILPVLSMPVLMGGITGQSLFRTALSLLNALFFALSAGLWISCRSWEQKRAANAAIWVGATALWLLPLLSFLIQQKFGWTEVALALRLLSPAYQLDRSNPFGAGMLNDHFWKGFLITHSLAWIALWRSCRILPHRWQDRPVGDIKSRWKQRFDQIRYGSTQQRLDLRRRLLNKNSVHWLGCRERFSPAGSWIFLGIMMVAWTAFWLYLEFGLRSAPPYWGIGIPVVMVMHLGLRMRACSLASEIIARDRVSGALELLLSTALTVKDVVRGQFLSFARVILGPAIASVVIGSIVFAFGVTAAGADDDKLWLIFICLGALFVADLVASFWTGLWMACISKTPNSAPGQAVLRLLVLPWVAFFALMTIGGLLDILDGLEFIDAFLTWFALCMANNIGWSVHSHNRFYQGLRIAAAERYQPPPERNRWWSFRRASKSSPQIRLSSDPV